MAEDDEAPPDEQDDEPGSILISDEVTEVFRTGDEMLAQIAIDEVLTPAGIDALVHNRVSHAFPAPASMSGAYFIAVRVDQAASACAALREAQAEGVLPPDGEVANL
jgi:hypothetical protein